QEKYKDNIDFSFDIKLQGSESIYFIPVGKTTTVALKSSWDSPSFQGRFVPDEREVSKDGFTANWKILDMNRNYPQQWEGNKYNVSSSKFGVDLIKPVGEYQKNMRTVKYSLLIIVLIFLIYFFFEVLGKFRIHPIQYSFIGLALTLFFVLLLSISEQIGFDLAYLVSAAATTIMILIYSAALLKNRKQLLILTGFLITIYGFIYVVLQLEDFALLAGSIGLFVALFITMYYSRKIDWYNIGIGER
ncbi:MAG TPA: cell envelope integrity protein CreD, partial [Bacteroidetes bacterium]|nr:cell envelope integrity protein CreD [Bacteroidota bacterium]